MTWKDTITLPSLNGIEFDYTGYRDGFGRRQRGKALPLNPRRAYKDTGRSVRHGSIDCLISGDDYLVQMKRLQDECEKPGVKTLVHPSKGKKQVRIVAEVEPVYSTKSGGMATFTLVYEEEEAKLGLGKLDTLGPVLSAADDARSAIDTATAAAVKVEGFPDFVRNAVDDLLSGPRGVIDAMRKAYGTVSAIIGLIDDVAYVIEQFGKELDDLLGLPGELASKLQNAMRKLFGLAPSANSGTRRAAGAVVDVASASLQQMKTVSAVTAPVVEENTPSRRRQAENQRAILGAVKGSAAVEATAIIVATPDAFTSRTRALEVSEELVASLTEAAEEATDDGLYLALKRLAAAAREHFTAVSLALPATTTFTPTGDIPALVLAHRLYGDATRADDIIARNPTVHPGFIPGGEPIEVLHD